MRRRYFNREISWLEFNSRVLEEALDPRNPLLEQVKFLGIFHSNLDEFFMIRVSGLQEQVESGLVEPSEDGLTPTEQLSIIRKKAISLRGASYRHFQEKLRPRLKRHGVCVYDYGQLTKAHKAALKSYFDTNVYPVLTPLAVDPGHPFPHISNLSLSLAVVIRNADGDELFARVKIPAVLPRLVPLHSLPGIRKSDLPRKCRYAFMWLEDLIAAHMDSLFKGMTVVNSYPFRVVRDADLEIREDEAGDLLSTIEQSLVRRRFGSVTRLVVTDGTPKHIRELLARNMEVEPQDVYETPAPLGLSSVISLYDLDLPELKDPPFRPRVPAPLFCGEDLFGCIRARDILLHQPSDSFAPVTEFIQRAAKDPDVLAIKQTIYRVGKNSPIIPALAEASLAGKQVSVVVELKARFDEENNIEWARMLERAGAHVIYGDVELKTHCKVLLVVRKDPDGIRRYVHMSTGNYNARTATVYTDLCLFTCDPLLGDDASALFNSLTGYSRQAHYNKLLVSPGGIRLGIAERIDREIRNAGAGRPARIIFKVNSLTDFRMADALYKASKAGVKIDLIVRGSCCVVPGVPGMSDNIHVRSVVGRFLEHSRLYYFLNAGSEEVWLGSADLMERNLDRRVETLFPVEDPDYLRWLAHELLPAYLRDTRNARELRPDGSYKRLHPKDGEEPFDVQCWFLGRSAVPDSLETVDQTLVHIGD